MKYELVQGARVVACGSQAECLEALKREVGPMVTVARLIEDEWGLRRAGTGDLDRRAAR